jgi:hypothetical protein
VTAMYSFIAEEKANPGSAWSTAEMCRVLEVSRQGFYDWESPPPSQHQVTDRLLADRSDLGMFGTQLRATKVRLFGTVGDFTGDASVLYPGSLSMWHRPSSSTRSPMSTTTVESCPLLRRHGSRRRDHQCSSRQPR